jgi:homoserine dehydrogenase
MPHSGQPGFAIMLFAAVGAAIPICTFVFSLLTYRAVRRMEARLNSPS